MGTHEAGFDNKAAVKTSHPQCLICDSMPVFATLPIVLPLKCSVMVCSPCCPTGLNGCNWGNCEGDDGEEGLCSHHPCVGPRHRAKLCWGFVDCSLPGLCTVAQLRSTSTSELVQRMGLGGQQYWVPFCSILLSLPHPGLVKTQFRCGAARGEAGVCQVDVLLLMS